MNNFENINFKKRFGQNFLTDTNLLQSIVRDAGVTGEDVVVEIGAGAGTLTKEIAKVAKKVISFEVDRELESILSQNLADFNNVNIIYEDFLNINAEKIYELAGKNFKVVANLPYYITTPIITKLFDLTYRPKTIVIMVQKEVGERIVADAQNSNYGYFSAYVRANADAKIVRQVKRNMFTPAPKVDSCIVLLNTKENNYPSDFFEFLKNVFKMKRKTILNNLVSSYDISKEQLSQKLSNELLQKRADALSVKQLYDVYLKLFK